MDEASKEVGENLTGVSFEDVYVKFHHQVRGWIRAQVRNIEHSDEIAQEVFLKLYRNIETYDPTRPLAAWLRTLTRNTVTDWFRAQGTRVHAEAGAAESAAPFAPPAESTLVERAETLELFQAFKKLSLLQRKVLLMRIFRERSYDEISEQLGVSIAAAKCAMYRARASLLREWQPAEA